MSLPNEVNPLLLGGSGAYNISRSLRFRSSASAYLNRTLTTPTDSTKFTFSVWVKRGALGSSQGIFQAGNTNYIQFGSSDVIQLVLSNTNQLTTSSVYRDPAAWGHLVVSYNNAVSPKWNFYYNNVNIGTSTASNTTFNTATAHGIANPPSGGGYFDGYMTETNFIDGQALTPSSFGAFNAKTGVWQPAKYTGSYGTNGFYLPFSNNASTTTLGADASGNGNNWTTNNISLTAGATYDSMTDVPTLTSATAANYAVFNPLYKGPNISAINANLQTSWASTGNFHETIAATIAVNSGKWYWEITKNDTRTNSETIGIIRSDVTQSNMNGQMAYGQSASPSYSWSVEGNKYKNSASGGAYGSAWTTNGDIIGVALDLSTNPGTITMYKNGVSQGAMYSDIDAAYSWIPAVSGYGDTATSSFIANFGQRPFTYTPPSGFVALNTYNLPTPTISNGANYMAATTYTGNGSTQSINNAVNGVSMQPDLVWVKGRSVAYSHGLYDSVRGVNKRIISNLTNAEDTLSGVSAFNSGGFSLGSDINFNENAATYVGWQWKANGSAVTNTAGSITSQVSANTTAGFSVVTYTGTGANATVGHGLGVAPSMIIFKNRQSTTSWLVYHTSMGNTNAMFLNGTSASGAFSTYFNNTSPTSTVFSLGSDTSGNGANNIVAYCFAAVPGYSAFGSYTGNGSTDGPFVYTNFRPRFVLIKSSSDAVNWYVYDTSRDTSNLAGNQLYPNLSNAEVSSVGIDILSNGFKLRYNASPLNASGSTYIYACFAENPSKLALAR